MKVMMIERVSKQVKRWVPLSLVLSVSLGLVGCGGQQAKPQQQPALRYFSGSLVQEPLSEQEQLQVLAKVQSQANKPYVWGGQSERQGFDCSGILVWSFQQLGLQGFKYRNGYEKDVTADALYLYNTHPLTEFVQLRKGDWIFLDPKGKGYQTHVAVFSHVDNEGQVWVWDASSNAGKISLRPVTGFWNKRPVFGRPMKLIPSERAARTALLASH